MSPHEDSVLFAFDLDLRRPGCVILQAVYGADTRAAQLFDAELWLVAPTPGMQVFRVKRETIAMLAKQLNEESRSG